MDLEAIKRRLKRLREEGPGPVEAELLGEPESDDDEEFGGAVPPTSISSTNARRTRRPQL